MPSIPFRRRRDPWWDLEGKSVRRNRRLRRLLEILVAVGICAMLLIVFKPMNARATGAGASVDQRDHVEMSTRTVAPR